MKIFGSQGIEDFLSQDYQHYTREMEKTMIENLLLSGEEDIEIMSHIQWEYTLAHENMRHLKNSMICFVTLICRAAMDFGGSEIYCFGASDYWINEIEAHMTIDQQMAFYERIIKDFRQAVSERNQGQESLVIKRAIKYIDRHIYEKITLAETAKGVGVHKDYLSRCFHQQVGVTFSDYVTKEKIKKAQKLLEKTDHSVLEISNQLGMSSATYFIRVFKKALGMTPRAYRQKMGL